MCIDPLLVLQMPMANITRTCPLKGLMEDRMHVLPLAQQVRLYSLPLPPVPRLLFYRVG